MMALLPLTKELLESLPRALDESEPAFNDHIEVTDDVNVVEETIASVILNLGDVFYNGELVTEEVLTDIGSLQDFVTDIFEEVNRIEAKLQSKLY